MLNLTTYAIYVQSISTTSLHALLSVSLTLPNVSINDRTCLPVAVGRQSPHSDVPDVLPLVVAAAADLDFVPSEHEPRDLPCNILALRVFYCRHNLSALLQLALRGDSVIDDVNGRRSEQVERIIKIMVVINNLDTVFLYLCDVGSIVVDGVPNRWPTGQHSATN